MKHAHKFERLSDVAIYCACGQIKFADPSAQCTWPHYPQPYVVYPTPYTVPAWPHYPTWWGTTTVSTGDPTTATTYAASGVSDNVTYTLTSGGTS